MSKSVILAAILAAAGNPESGAIAELAPAMAEAVEKALQPEKEVRVTKPTETR